MLACIILIAVSGLVLISPLIHEPPHLGWFDLSWNGPVPFVFVPLGQWVLFAVAGPVIGIVWLRSGPCAEAGTP